MSTQYLEINSTYRNRNDWPLPSEFDVFFSQSGSRNKLTSVDPVCKSAIRLIWTPFKPVTGRIVPYPVGAFPNDTGVGAASASSYVMVQIDTTQLASRSINFYSGAVLVIPSSNSYYRILGSVFYLVGPKTAVPQTSVLDTFDYFLLNIASSAVNPQPNALFEIRDPSQFTGSDYPVIPSIVRQYYFPTLFIPTGVNSTNFYISYIIYNQSHNEWLQITYYDGVTHMASTYPYNDAVNSDFPAQVFTHFTPGLWSREDTYILRRSPPEELGSVVSVNPTNGAQIKLPPTSSNIPNYYVGSFLRNQVPFQYSNFVNPNYRIIAYNPKFPDWGGPPGSTIPVLTLDKVYDNTLTPLYEIMQFTADNEYPYPYDGSIVSLREAICYDIELLNIVLPNAFMGTSNGSRIVFYPYLYVELTPINNSERFGPNSITSNNPNARRMLFRALIRDYVSDTTSPFVRIDGGGMRQRVKLLPCDNFHISIHLPDGSLFKTILPEYYGPDIPNELNQISAVFAFRRVE